MEHRRREILTEGGIDVEEALERLMDNEALLERFLKKFLEDDTFERLEKAAQKGDAEGMLAASHALKGMCANLAMTRLSSLLAGQVALLRAGDATAAAEMMPGIRIEYERTAAAVRKN